MVNLVYDFVTCKTNVLYFLIGYNIPKILADLRDQMDFTNGLKEEGIFRLSGSEAEIVSLLAEYTNGSVSHFDAHNAANLMKRWFKSWSGKRLLGEIPMEEFAQSPNIDVTKYLSEPQLSIWRWLLQLLFDCYAFREYNKMSAKNLGEFVFCCFVFCPNNHFIITTCVAIVWTPALIGEQEAEHDVPDLNETLLLTQYGTTLLEHLIENNGIVCTKKNTSPTRKRGHSRSKSVNVVPEDDTVTSPRLIIASKPLHKRRTPKRGMMGEKNSQENLHHRQASVGMVTDQFKPPPLLSSASHTELTVAPTDIVLLADLAKTAALPPPICEKKVRKPPPSLQTPLY